MPMTHTANSHDLPTAFDDLVRHHPPLPVHDKTGHENTLEIFDALMRLPKHTKGQSQYLELLGLILKSYEDETGPFDTSKVSPLDALKHLLEQHEMTASDLGRLLGDRSLGSKILNGDRELSKAHIAALSNRFHVSTDLFIR